MIPHSNELLNLLHPSCRDRAINAYAMSVHKTPVGVHPIITQTIRTFEEQDYMYLQGRTRTGSIITYSEGGQSYHNYGLALDFAMQISGKLIWKIDENWLTVVECFRKAGFECGIDWKGKKRDAPHFQMNFGQHWSILRKKYENKDFIEGTTYVRI